MIFFWVSCWIHCLAALDLGAGVQWPFTCLIVQNRQAMQSMGRSLDWTMEDNMADGLFCTILTGRRGGHIPFVQPGSETSDTGAEAVKPDPGSSWDGHSGRVGTGVGDENVESCGAVPPLRIPLVIRPLRRTYVVNVRWTDEMFAAGTNGCLDFRRRAFALDGRVSAKWSRCPGSMARRARDSVAPLRWSSACWIPARVGRLYAGVVRRHPVTIRKASLMTGSMRRVWALRHQTAAQYSAVECTKARVAICRVVAPATQLEPASRLRSATRDVSFLRSDSRCRAIGGMRATCATLLRGISARYSEVFLLGAEGQGFVVVFDFKLTFSFLVVEVEGCRHHLCSAEL